eukprot:s4486_g7.t2
MRFINSVIVMSFILHPVVVRPILVVGFECEELDVLRHRHDLGVECKSTTHMQWLCLSTVGLVVYGIGVPVALFIALFRVRKRLFHAEVRKRFGFLYNGFELRYYYFESVYMFRKVMILLFFTAPTMYVRMVLMLFTSFGFILLHVYSGPFDNRSYLCLDRLEALNLLALTVTVSARLIFDIRQELSGEFFEDFVNHWTMDIVLVSPYTCALGPSRHLEKMSCGALPLCAMDSSSSYSSDDELFVDKRSDAPERELMPKDPAGVRFSWRTFAAYVGPGWLMSLAYLDPGNLESDLQSGAYTGHSLLWVLLLCTVAGLILQVLAARLAVVTGCDLAQTCRMEYPRQLSRLLWIMTELAIIGADIQEVVGTGIALRVLFGWPLWVGSLATGVDTFTFLLIHQLGKRFLEIFILILISLLLFCYLANLFLIPPSAEQLLHGFNFHCEDYAALQLVGSVGAMIMPHNLYLHSGICKQRTANREDMEHVRQAIKYTAVDSSIALVITFLINAALMSTFATGFFNRDCALAENGPLACLPSTGSHSCLGSDCGCMTGAGSAGFCGEIGLAEAGNSLHRLFGDHGEMGRSMFALGLLAAGQASTMTGTIAGQYVMEGFLDWRIPFWLRTLLTRLISLGPAVAVAVLTSSSPNLNNRVNQWINVLQSVQLPFALVPVLHFNSDKALMGEFVLKGHFQVFCWLLAMLLISVNVYLLAQNMKGGSLLLQALTMLFCAMYGSLILFTMAGPLLAHAAFIWFALWSLFRNTVLKHLLLKADIWPEKMSRLQKCLLGLEIHKQKAAFDEDERGLWIDTSSLSKQERHYMFVAMCDTLHRYMNSSKRVHPGDVTAAIQEALIRCRRARRKRAVRLEQLDREFREQRQHGRRGCLSRLIRWQRVMNISLYGDRHTELQEQEPGCGPSRMFFCACPQRKSGPASLWMQTRPVRELGLGWTTNKQSYVEKGDACRISVSASMVVLGTLVNCFRFLGVFYRGCSLVLDNAAGTAAAEALRTKSCRPGGQGDPSPWDLAVLALRTFQAHKQGAPKKYLMLETEKGDVSLLLRPDSAPHTVEHVCKLVNASLYDGCYFYRSDFVLQWGLWLPSETEVDNPYPDIEANETQIGTFISNSPGTASIISQQRPAKRLPLAIVMEKSCSTFRGEWDGFFQPVVKSQEETGIETLLKWAVSDTGRRVRGLPQKALHMEMEQTHEFLAEEFYDALLPVWQEITEGRGPQVPPQYEDRGMVRSMSQLVPQRRASCVEASEGSGNQDGEKEDPIRSVSGSLHGSSMRLEALLGRTQPLQTDRSESGGLERFLCRARSGCRVELPDLLRAHDELMAENLHLRRENEALRARPTSPQQVSPGTRSGYASPTKSHRTEVSPSARMPSRFASEANEASSEEVPVNAAVDDDEEEAEIPEEGSQIRRSCWRDQAPSSPSLLNAAAAAFVAATSLGRSPKAQTRPEDSRSKEPWVCAMPLAPEAPPAARKEEVKDVRPPSPQRLAVPSAKASAPVPSKALLRLPVPSAAERARSMCVRSRSPNSATSGSPWRKAMRPTKNAAWLKQAEKDLSNRSSVSGRMVPFEFMGAARPTNPAAWPQVE